MHSLQSISLDLRRASANSVQMAGNMFGRLFGKPKEEVSPLSTLEKLNEVSMTSLYVMACGECLSSLDSKNLGPDYPRSSVGLWSSPHRIDIERAFKQEKMHFSLMFIIDLKGHKHPLHNCSWIWIARPKVANPRP